MSHKIINPLNCFPQHNFPNIISSPWTRLQSAVLCADWKADEPTFRVWWDCPRVSHLDLWSHACDRFSHIICMIFNSKCHSVKALKTPLLELEKDHDLGYQIFQKFVFLVGMATPPPFLYPSMNAKKRINFFMTISQTADETGMIHFTVTSMFFKNKMR